MSSKTPIIIVIACLLAAGAGYLLYRGQHPAAEASASFPAAGPIAGAGTASPKLLPAEIRLTDLDGKTHTLDEYRGKLLVVNFWATWCGPCLHEIPTLIKIQNDYAAKGFQIVGPAVDDPGTVRAEAGKLGFNYPVFVGESDAMLDLMTELGNTAGALPFSVVIGPDGKIIDRQLGEFSPVELAGLIEDHLGSK